MSVISLWMVALLLLVGLANSATLAAAPGQTSQSQAVRSSTADGAGGMGPHMLEMKFCTS